MGKKVGIITLHEAYNCGSVLQAQATQQIIERLGFETQIINYKPKLYDEYDELYCKRGHNGIKGMFYYFLLKLQVKKRKARIHNFQKYFQKNLIESKNRYYSYQELAGVANEYDTFVSGSDQIWSVFVPEIAQAGNETVNGYFLGFTEQKKISYASSVASMEVDDLLKYKQLLDRYDVISTRERIGAERLSKVTQKHVEVVVDPSFLLTEKEWNSYASAKRMVEEKYVLLYSLRNHVAQKSWEKGLRVFAKRNNLKIVVLAPYFEIPMKGVINMLSAGPAEFLNLFSNAEVICTDSFHGTAFSIIYNKPFYSLGTKYWKKDIRKNELLKWLQLEDRIINDETDIAKVVDYSCDFSDANVIMNNARKKSIDFIKENI